jgi:hypothetical protein
LCYGLLATAVTFFAMPASTLAQEPVAVPEHGPGQVPANVTPPPSNTWESKWGVDQRGKFGGLMRTYMCLSADPPPECLRRQGDTPTDAASLEDIEAVKREALDLAEWKKLREAWPNIAFNEDDVGVITRRVENHDDPEALEMLGFMRHHGNGVPQDSVEAFKTYRRAYEGGRKTAGPALAEVFRSLSPPQKQELNTWLKAQGGDATIVKERKLGPPQPSGPTN